MKIYVQENNRIVCGIYACVAPQSVTCTHHFESLTSWVDFLNMLTFIFWKFGVVRFTKSTHN